MLTTTNHEALRLSVAFNDRGDIIQVAVDRFDLEHEPTVQYVLPVGPFDDIQLHRLVLMSVIHHVMPHLM